MSVRRIVFIVTQECQLRCNYCYLIGKNGSGKMTCETAKKIVDFLTSLPVKEDSVVFDFIGGEPLLEIDLISTISDYITSELIRLNHPWQDSYRFRFTTNGLLYSSPKVQKYISHYKDILDIQISIDGTKQKHDMNRVYQTGIGSYEDVLPNVKLWIDQFKEKATAFMVISHEDLPYLSESILHHIKLGIRNIYVSFVVEDVWKKGDGLVLEKELMIVADHIINNNLSEHIILSPFRAELGVEETENHIHPCGNPMYTFDSTGNIYSCIRFKQFSLREKQQRTIGTITDGIDYNKLRPLLIYERDIAYPPECIKCEIGACCRWCPAENYDSSESATIYQRTTTVCELHKANVRAKNYFWNVLRNSSKL